LRAVQIEVVAAVAVRAIELAVHGSGEDLWVEQRRGVTGKAGAVRRLRRSGCGGGEQEGEKGSAHAKRVCKRRASVRKNSTARRIFAAEDPARGGITWASPFRRKLFRAVHAKRLRPGARAQSLTLLRRPQKRRRLRRRRAA